MVEQTADQAIEELFGDALACDTEMPAALRSKANEAQTVERALDHAETVLRSLALIEDSPHHDEDSDPSSRDLNVLRLEAKLNLILETLASILRRERSDLPLQTLRWSRRGAEVVYPATDPPAQGYLLLQPMAWLPQRLELPVVTLASRREGQHSTRVWLRFSPQPASLQAALEKHLFRLHRRQIAQRRTSGT